MAIRCANDDAINPIVNLVPVCERNAHGSPLPMEAPTLDQRRVEVRRVVRVAGLDDLTTLSSGQEHPHLALKHARGQPGVDTVRPTLRDMPGAHKVAELRIRRTP